MTEVDNCTYIGVFLTFSCQYKCPYCINRHGDLSPRKHLTGSQWSIGLSKIRSRPDLPLTLQGGEPTLHKDFYSLVYNLYIHGQYLDLLTNFDVNIDKWLAKIAPRFFSRPSPYPSIRVSYHPGQSPLLGLLYRVYRASKSGMSIGIWAVDHPAHRLEIRLVRRLARLLGIDYRLKEFLGWYDHAFYGEYKYEDAISHPAKSVLCKSNELLIAPDGYIHRCHADLYANRNPIGHILDSKLPEIGKWRPCDCCGDCSPCDVKLKTNRHQVSGYCSVEIQDCGRSQPPDNGG